ncbi:hypothetical protein O3G_MSEX012891 [Manduca sexta]|uniref:Hemocytin n=1 Tax=Manduca sexta TaxID=7130 RepID=A0A921ZQ95_MANSE|nr:hypothetical protein O3G_MSEX012891 [Manduca sexta]
MDWFIQTFILVFGLYVCDAGYGVPAPSGSQYSQADAEAPAYVPPYLKHHNFAKTGHSKTYSGTKTFSGTKTGYGGWKHGFGGGDTGYVSPGYSGPGYDAGGGYGSPTPGYGYPWVTPPRYAETRSWHSHSGEVPNYQQFYNNANQAFQPKCEPECKNTGICVDTNTCLCSANYYGKYCEFEKKPCLSYPPLPMNSMRKCSSELCTVTCMEGYRFIDGSTVANMRCTDGQWTPTRADFTSIPDCEPECNPPCLNGGVCLALNTCQCPSDYRGPQCQYATNVCDIRKLAFNGGYKCFGDSEKFSCKLNCPPGSSYSTPPAEVYTCTYASGIYQPQPIPHCVFNDVVIITPSNQISTHRTDIHTDTSSESHNVTSTQVIDTLRNTKHPHTYAESQKKVQVIVQDLTPKGGTCMTWAGVHYKTFDGVIYSFESPCQHVLVQDSKEHKFKIAVKHGDCKTPVNCPSELTIYLEDKPYILAVGEDGSVVFRTTRRLIPIPASLPGIRVAMPSDYIQVNLDNMGVTIKWDMNNIVMIEGTVVLWNNTEGLCGRLDGNPENDLVTKDGNIAKTKAVLASSWQINKIGDLCDSNPTETSACASKSDDDMKRAMQFCTKIFTKEKFRKCSKVMDVSMLLEACQWDYCACTTSLSPEECACSTVSVYAKECLRHGVEEMKNWRDADTCPISCPDGKLYKSCGPDVQPSCAFPSPPNKADNSSCVEGCFCPEGLLLEGGRCIPKSECPCRLRNKSFKPGTVLPKDCNTCTCQAGEWTCTQVPCGARCSAVGDPHYTTFDGLRYNFMGRCTYTLFNSGDVNIEVENIACSGAITEAMNLAPYTAEGKPSCTKAVSLSYNGVNIHLKQGGFVLANGKEISTLPVVIGDIRIRAASSLFLIVQLPNKVDLWWDGNTRVFVDVPPEFHDKTKGLCGTFNLNQKDDFLTPENDVEQSVLAFANKWKTREFCLDVDTKEPEHPCKANVENKEAAEKYCSKLKSKLFESCHWYVDVEPYYESCLYDMCACAGDVTRCLCPILGDYAMACAKAGVMVQWRYNVKECELSCTGGQEYTVCADSCLRKCSDTALAASGTCKPSCVEGCACPTGQLLDDSGVCVPVGLCPCYHKGLQFNAGYKEVRAGKRERELCTCVGARWDCAPATPEEIQNYPPAEDLRTNCSASNNMEFTTCEIAEPLTCKNMHLPPSSTTAECRPGCQCKKGYVLETVSKKCVLATECPCHHGGRSYPDGHVMQEECNKCECKNGNWTCTKRKCAGVCSAWGDSHVTSFDGTDYDFEGVCTYLLAKGVMDGNDGFDVEIQNVPCGTTGATCSKSVTLKVGGGGNEEIVSLTKNAPIPDISKLKRIKLRIAGIYVFLDVPSLGMSLQWDRELRVYVKIDSMWQNRVKGLCGNYNGDMRDDFQTPSGGGMAESSALIFADSWKLKPTCPKPQPAIDHCKQRPERREWAQETCGALKRYPLSLCHAEVPVGAFVQRCERDACACDAGGDCACACAALAAYAHACSLRGLDLRWRTPQLCPMQCDEECSNYDPCVSACPVETCDNTLYYTEMKTNCEQDTCVEGCKPKKSCPEGTVYKNSSLTDCVPRAKCKPVCMTLEDGREILEGEVIEEDACHTCRCSKKHRVCTGQPCSTEPPHIGSTEPSSEKPHDEPLKCATGWTNWINRGPPETGPNGESIDNEPLPKPKELQIGSPMCKPDMMKKIECRTVEGHKEPKETGLDVECSLEKGLVCKEVGKACPDFEIRVFCECEIPEACVTSERPNDPHPTDCSKFYECAPHGPTLKDCAPGTLYNPVAMVCDWPAVVIPMRPECGVAATASTPTTVTLAATPSTPTTVEEEEQRTLISKVPWEPAIKVPPSPVPSRCPPGKVYKPCAYPCDKLCDYFKRILLDKGRCMLESCVDGCVDESVANIECNFGSFWRDEQTCVPVHDCTCFRNGDIVRPHGVIHEGCISCQCMDNELHCDSSHCPMIGSTHLPMMEYSPSVYPIYSPTPSTKAPVKIPITIPSSVGSTPSTPGISSPPLIIKTTVTPPPECAPDRYIDLMMGDQPLPDSSYSASSKASELFAPHNAKLFSRPNDVSAGSWNPQISDKNQYIQVELPTREPIYGVVMQGSPLFNQYVTSYEVLYGDDGHTFSTVDGPDGKSKVFRGPVDNNTPLKQMFEPPIEAKVVRIHPLTWHDDIAVRMELIGCGELTTTTITTRHTTVTTLEPMQCTEPLGLASNLPLRQIDVSSNSDAKRYFKLDGERGWKPLYSTPGEWVMFDFTSPRNLTGITTKGGPSGWVTSYKVLYTSDLTTFNPIIDEDGKEKVFPANYDNDSAVTNEFRPPIHAQYLKILPLKWKGGMEMRVEPIGCFEPYAVTEMVPIREETTTFSPKTCEVCPGVQDVVDCDCKSPDAPYYDGENCVARNQCPCVESFMTYPVGSTFRGTNCDECVCKLGGVTSCKPVKACECDNVNLVPKLSPKSCECSCEPCPPGTKICPTSKLCLPLEKWCDGLQDCPDDERDCTTTMVTVTEAPVITTVAPTAAATQPSTTTTIAPSTTTKPEECPEVKCPPGYIISYATKSSYTRYATSDLPPPRPRVSYQRYYRGYKGGYGRGGYAKGGYAKGGYAKGGYSKGGLPPPPKPNQAFSLDKPDVDNSHLAVKKECVQFRCIPKLPPFVPPGATAPPVVCTVTTCPPGYTVKLERSKFASNMCPQYECVPPPERPVFCNMTGRTFNTFDGNEYKYDVCFHILARDNRFDAWLIILRKKCVQDGCQNELIVMQDDQLILVKPNMMIEYDNYEYTIEQTRKICFQKNSFDVDRLGDGVSIKSRKYNFTVLFTKNGDVKIGVLTKLQGTVDGMCGAFDGNPRNDRQLPDGRLATTIDEFGRGWGKPGLPADACAPRITPPNQQQEVWDLCKVITEEPLSQCAEVLNLNKWRHICLENVLECSQLVVNGTKRSHEECRCLFLEQMVAECLAAAKDLDVAAWRIMMDCPAECAAPLVHYDCYRKRCEPTCAGWGPARAACPAEEGQCFPGCYCPDGTLRKGDQCVVPADCLDCTCTGVGTPGKYVTFEGDDLPFMSNCTYLASQDRNETGQHKYQVFATNGPCEDNPAVVCTKSVHLVYGKDVIHITKDASKKLLTMIGSKTVYKYPVNKEWGTISLVNGQDVTVRIQDIHVELTVLESKMEFAVQVPSFLYANQTEGLCGVCAGYQEELITSNGTATNDFEEYGKSWQASPAALEQLDIPPQEQCTEPEPPPECVTPPPENNPCFNLYNADRFGPCHALVDPEPFVASCEADLCANASDACAALGRYAAACSAHDVCLPHWRRDLCPYPCEAPLVYRTCVDCERTCENNEELEKSPEKCTNKPVEGCFCPEGMVRLNNTCIEPSKCFPCDAKKEHYAGDEWKEDACTSCTCSKIPGENSAHVSCTTQGCAPPTCSDAQDLVSPPPRPGQCCPEYHCAPKKQEHCEEAKKIVCGFGQVLKQKTLPNGCKTYACECKPASECEQIPSESEVEIMEPGMERLIDNSGCCPRVDFICRVETCPKPPTCPKFHNLKTANVSGKCCPEYSCELPKDKCVVTLEWESASKGGEKARKTPEVVLKDTEAVWADGPCRSCRCEAAGAGAGAGPAPRCAVTECEPIVSSEQFVLEPRAVPFACCPVPQYVACRDRDNVYKVGENWTSPTNPCEKYQCVQADDGKLEKVTTVQHCDDDCQPGWKYFPADAASGECCGKCRPVACVVDGVERPIGEKWTSSDFCANFTCVNLEGTLQVQSSNETCAEMPSTLKKQFVVETEKVEGKCCPKFEPVACKFGDKVYKVGENWTDPTDPCEMYSCARAEDGKLERLTTRQHCDTTCQLGWKYEAADPKSGECCGRCKPVACVFQGLERPVGDVWVSADFCTNYTCADINGTLQVESSDETCPEVSEAVRKQFVLKEEKVPGKCCPIEEVVACRVGDKIYQENQTWPSSNPCVNVSCSRDADGKLAHTESVQACDKSCRRGWSYRAPAPAQCCGRCVQSACVLPDRLVEPGSTWQSEDNCTTYSCDQAGEEIFVTSARPICPDVSKCEPEDLVNETCCQVCREKGLAHSKCTPEVINSAKTIGLIRVHKGVRGLCVNNVPLRGFAECRGSCDSGTLYNNQTGSHDSKCECCQASKYSPVMAELTCEDGSTVAHQVASPSKCACQPCGGPTVSKWHGSKSRYTGTKTPKVPAHDRDEEEDYIPSFARRFGEVSSEKPPRR